MAPEMLQNRAWRRVGLQFLKFWGVVEGCQFLMNFKNEKTAVDFTAKLRSVPKLQIGDC